MLTHLLYFNLSLNLFYRFDAKFYKGRSMDRRINERQQEIERDEYDKEQDFKEIEELKRKLKEEGPDKETQLLSLIKNMNPNLTDSERNESLRQLRDVAKNNPDLLEGSKVKTFGFAGMKISSNTDGGVAGSSTSANGSNTVTIPPMGDMNEEDSNSQSDLRSRRLINVYDVFNANDEDEANSHNGKKRRPPPNSLLEDSNTDSNVSTTSGQPSHMSQEEKKRQIKNLIDKIPLNKNELFNYNIDWDLLENVSFVFYH